MQEDVLNAEKPIDAQIDSTAILTEKNMIANEHRIMDAIVNNSVSIPEETLLLARQRDNYASASSDPIKDISVGRQLAYKKSGKMPNKLLISIDVLFILTNHPKIIARFP